MNEKSTSNMGTFKNCKAKDDPSKGTAAEELARVEGYIADAKKLQTQANLIQSLQAHQETLGTDI